MVTFMRQFTCINHNHWVFVILITQIMCAACENHFMVLSKHLVPGTNALLTLSPPLNFSIALQTTHSSSTSVALIWLTSFFMLMTSSSSPPPMIFKINIMTLLATEFAMKDLSPLSYFSGIVVTRHDGGLFLRHSTYASDTIARAGMASCKPSATPVDTKQKLSTTASISYDDPTFISKSCRSLAVSYFHPT